jgi:hypothetical protein
MDASESHSTQGRVREGVEHDKSKSTVKVQRSQKKSWKLVTLCKPREWILPRGRESGGWSKQRSSADLSVERWDDT